MKAVIWTAYGPPEVLKLREIEKPSPKENEVLIKIHASTVTAGDCEMRALKFPFWLKLPMRMYAGFSKPTRLKTMGQELAGEIESTGKDVKLFKEGDQVYAALGFGKGAYAEYITLSEKPDMGVLAPKPANLSYEQAAAVPVGGIEALHFLQTVDLQPGQRVLINGAGGSIGTIGVQLAKHKGAEVTAVDSAGKLDMLRSIGADHVIDYTQEDFTQNGEIYDVIFDVIGKAPYSGSIRSLKAGGFYLIANPQLSKIFRGLWTSRTSGKRVFAQTSSPKTEDLLHLKELCEAGVIKPVIDRTYPLEQIVEAHRYVEAGGKIGNLVITVAHSNN